MSIQSVAALRKLPPRTRAVMGANLISAVGTGLVQPFLVLYLTQVRGLSVGTATAIISVIAAAALVGGPLAGRLAAAPEHAEGWSRPVWVPEDDLTRAAAVAAPAAGPDAPRVRETDTCCVFFTSGSTGRPKGVLSPHSGTVRLFSPARFVGIGPGTVMPQAAPLPCDAASLELWSVLLGGGTSALIDEPYLTADALRTLVREAGVNTLWLTASVFNLFVEEDLGCFDGVRQLMVGRERLSPAHVRRFVRAYPGTTLVNGYGPVESTVFTTTHRITSADLTADGEIPLGRPVPRTEVFVLDGESRPCPPGVTGEICIAGAGLANGYLANPEQTAKSFTETDLDGPRRIYRTGDLGHLSADGVLHYAGRDDRQVKVRGHRIEPGEVEARVAALPGIRGCAVIPLMEEGGCVGLAAAYTVVDGETVTERTVRGALAKRLPDYLVPRVLAAVDAFPLTGNGKLDTGALLELVTRRSTGARHRAGHSTGPGGGTGTRPDEGSVLSEVARAFAETLRTEDAVPYDTSLFELGGDSLDGARLCVRIGARTGVPVPASVFVAGPTVRKLAHWIESRTEADRARAAEALPASGEPLPLLPPPLTVPGPDGDGTASSPTFRISAADWAELEARAHRWGSTRFAVTLAAYAEALAVVTGDRDLAIGAPIAKRYHPDTADAVGCLIDVVCFRTRPAGDGTTDSLPALLDGVHAALAAQDVPFEDVVRLAADPARDRSRHPLFQTLFALQSVPPRHLVLEGCTADFVRPRSAHALHELEAEIWPETDGGAEVVLGHRPQSTSSSFVAEVATVYRRLLRDLAAGAELT
nr:AMP-binding protein [Streptomyces sp. NBC_00857]